jgi:hypothetical protein
MPVPDVPRSYPIRYRIQEVVTSIGRAPSAHRCVVGNARENRWADPAKPRFTAGMGVDGRDDLREFPAQVGTVRERCPGRAAPGAIRPPGEERDGLAGALPE